MTPRSSALRPLAYALLLAGVAVAYILSPFVLTLLFAASLAIVLSPVQARLHRVLRHRGVTALVVVGMVVILFLIPAAWLVHEVAREASILYDRLATLPSQSFPALASHWLSRGFPLWTWDLSFIAEQLVGLLARSATDVVAMTVGTALRLIVGGLALFYFLRDGSAMVAALRRYSPLESELTDRLLAQVVVTVNSIVGGNLLVAVAQGLVTGVVLSLFGVPAAVLWGTLAVIAAVAPAVGPSAVLLPAILWLAATHGWMSALGAALLGLGGVWLLGNLVGPFLASRGSHAHELSIMVAVLGGLALFGPLGFLVGPIAVSLFAALARTYVAERHRTA